MKPQILLPLVLVYSLFFSCSEATKVPLTATDISIIPEPAMLTMGRGEFEFNADTRFVATTEVHKALLSNLAVKFNQVAGFEPMVVDTAPAENYVMLTANDTLGPEGYAIHIGTNHIDIKATENSGFVYALETLGQLLPAELESNKKQANILWTVPNLEITDEPRYPWRGLMLDVSRHFFEKEYLLKTIDRMAFFKLNTLHLHLVDDQGWRVEIKKYPKLTAIGAFRVDQEEKHWDARATNEPSQKGTYGGFYTQDDIKEIVAYADKKGIQVVPEIEMPAHVTSAVAAYPEISCLGTPVAVPSGGLWPITDIYCAGKEETFEFLENVLLETMALFPSKYIHIGGDEATRTNWEKCPHCQGRMKEEGLKNTAELQSYFIRRIERFLSSKGRILIGWDEILEGGLPPDATVMSWRGIRGGWEASKEGHDVIMTPSTVYLNQYQGDLDYEPIAWGGYEPLNKVYQFDPVVDSMSTEQRKHVLGSQANLWSEYVTTEDESEYMLFPRVPALAEALWTPKEKKSWPRFAKKLPILFDRFDAMDITYARSAYSVTTENKLNADGSIEIQLTNEFPASEIRYAFNTALLTKDAELYTKPLALKSTTTINAAVFENGEVIGHPLEKTFNFHKATGKAVTYEPTYNERYQGTGPNTLVNVFRGSKNFHDGQWLAWLEDDAQMLVDLEETTQISSVALGTLENQGSGIYYPTKIDISISEDGKIYRHIGTMARDFKASGTVDLKTFTVSFEPQDTRYIKINVTNLAHPPTGGSCFMFLDEIIVE